MTLSNFYIQGEKGNDKLRELFDGVWEENRSRWKFPVEKEQDVINYLTVESDPEYKSSSSSTDTDSEQVDEWTSCSESDSEKDPTLRRSRSFSQEN
jgi:hypothetical protein